MKNFILFTFAFLIAKQIYSQENRGIKVINITINNTSQEFYKQSHALVIGMSDYKNGWPNLPGVKNDVQVVKKALEKQDFKVVLLENATKVELDKSISDFISEYGQGAENRLLIYFAGHGHTIKTSYGDELGYIVPIDAPNPNKDAANFQSKAMEMAQIEIYAKRIQSKHALFLFDACFSGSLFALTRAVPEIISYKISQPVRLFISSGSANEVVPDVSIFCKQFVNAISSNDADANKDGYLTGTELGDFLQSTVVNYSYNTQHPQFGKIRNSNLDKGDFVFVLNTKTDNKTDVNLKQPKVDEKSLVYYGSVELETEIGGQLFIDSAFIKTLEANTQFMINDLKIGSHCIEIRGIENWKQSVNVSKEKKISIKAKNINIIPKQLLDNTESLEYNETTMGLNINMIKIKGGTFVMGCTNEQGSDCIDGEKPSHSVTLNSYYIGKYEVTQKQWKEVMGNNPSSFKNCEKCPVEHVSWIDIQEFLKKLNTKTGKTYDLPTEAQWEFASRGGNESKGYKYSGSNVLEDVAEYLGNNNKSTKPVGGKIPNELGLFDMSGNVLEWCADFYGNYDNNSKTNPKGANSGSSHIYRGGSWVKNSQFCRLSYRNRLSADGRYNDLGFRLVLVQ